MLKALDVLDDFIIDSDCIELDEVEETIIYLYLAMRLNPLNGKLDINENRINNIANILADNYFDKEISLDLMINAIYNYINTTSHSPSDQLLSDDIESFLTKYSEV